MSKISFAEFEQLMAYDVVGNYCCIEVEFGVDGDLEYISCWLGKTVSQDKSSAVFWYELVADGSQAYDFRTLEDMMNAKIFNNETIRDIWNNVTLFSIDGCDAGSRLQFYLGLEEGPIRRPASSIE